MRRILILAYDFPPYNSIGAKRPFSWFNDLINYDYYPIVVTRHWSDNIQNPDDYVKPSTIQQVEKESHSYGEIIRTPFKPNFRDSLLLKHGLKKHRLFRKCLTFFYSFFEYIHFIFDSRKLIYKESDKILKTDKIDIIIATGEPFILFKYASILSKKYNVPWVADYRDGWTSNYTKISRSFVEKYIVFKFFKLVECHLLKSARLITTVSKPMKNRLSKLHPNKQIKIIRNGYDPILFDNISTNRFVSYFNIVYAGTIYQHQRLEIFLTGFLKLTEVYKNIKCTFYGLDFDANQKDRLLGFDSRLSPHILTTPRIPQNEIAKKIKNAHVLLVLANENIDGSCAKIYEYLASKRKILCVVNDHSTLEEIISNTNSGYLCDSSDDVFLILKKLYEEWESTGNVSCRPSNIEEYTRLNQTKVLASEFNNIK